MTTTVEEIKSTFQIEKDIKDLKVFFRFEELKSQRNSMTMKVIATLRKEFDIHSDKTIYKIRSRVEANLSQLLADYPQFKGDYLKWKNRQTP